MFRIYIVHAIVPDGFSRRQWRLFCHLFHSTLPSSSLPKVHRSSRVLWLRYVVHAFAQGNFRETVQIALLQTFPLQVAVYNTPLVSSIGRASLRKFSSTVKLVIKVRPHGTQALVMILHNIFVLPYLQLVGV